ncbi:hypothetical protein [Methylopila sp. 73B]|uniref:hypothetical protein n=1 Tax=Methylopila sp. 73B TaxID=1120792 RepID=UPI00037E7753|nr:hypothetical protein [Methylopila sp. 73B]
MRSQLTKGLSRRVMYIENKDGHIEGVAARIGWVSFSKTGQTVYYRDRVLQKSKGGGVRGNFFDVESGEEFWVSGVKQRGSNVHVSENGVTVEVDEDAVDEYRIIRQDL